MADDDTPGDDPTNPFESMGMFGMPMFGDLSKMLAGQGPLNWDAARQFAVLSASGDPAAGMAGMMGAMGGPAGNQPAITGTPNIDPAVRIKYEELTEIVRRYRPRRVRFLLARVGVVSNGFAYRWPGLGSRLSRKPS